jgi:hypothetical protein
MCAWDTDCMRAIDPAISGLRAERTALLSVGDSQCRFAVEETDDPLHGYTDALDTRFIDAKRGALRVGVHAALVLLDNSARMRGGAADALLALRTQRHAGLVFVPG